MSRPFDFHTWTHENLARLCEELWLENKALREDNRTLLNQWRELVKQQLENKSK